MITLYCTLIINKCRTFDQIADIFKPEVKEKLTDLGYGINGDKLTVKR